MTTILNFPLDKFDGFSINGNPQQPIMNFRAGKVF
jgi:hypothetical protein